MAQPKKSERATHRVVTRDDETNTRRALEGNVVDQIGVNEVS
jgi:hypothetical protein